MVVLRLLKSILCNCWNNISLKEWNHSLAYTPFSLYHTLSSFWSTLLPPGRITYFLNVLRYRHCWQLVILEISAYLLFWLYVKMFSFGLWIHNSGNYIKNSLFQLMVDTVPGMFGADVLNLVGVVFEFGHVFVQAPHHWMEA